MKEDKKDLGFIFPVFLFGLFYFLVLNVCCIISEVFNWGTGHLVAYNWEYPVWFYLIMVVCFVLFAFYSVIRAINAKHSSKFCLKLIVIFLMWLIFQSPLRLSSPSHIVWSCVEYLFLLIFLIYLFCSGKMRRLFPGWGIGKIGFVGILIVFMSAIPVVVYTIKHPDLFNKDTIHYMPLGSSDGRFYSNGSLSFQIGKGWEFEEIENTSGLLVFRFKPSISISSYYYNPEKKLVLSNPRSIIHSIIAADAEYNSDNWKSMEETYYCDSIYNGNRSCLSTYMHNQESIKVFETYAVMIDNQKFEVLWLKKLDMDTLNTQTYRDLFAFLNSVNFHPEDLSKYHRIGEKENQSRNRDNEEQGE